MRGAGDRKRLDGVGAIAGRGRVAVGIRARPLVIAGREEEERGEKSEGPPRHVFFPGKGGVTMSGRPSHWSAVPFSMN